jgi:hypothetical protein
MHLGWFILVVALFVLLTPSIIVRLPPKGNKFTVALVHGIIFTVILKLMCHQYFNKREGLTKKSNMKPVKKAIKFKK